ncbi:EamA family transporter [Desulfovirgula thermocuniculi]|uniref:EamA family transporter n=1 Tax=Desulfovirgula thermocuniculi TaxID=348842 RepID=UPI000403C378|nr:EamA family transporter [Desulfovirgula thermocuniculi]
MGYILAVISSLLGSTGQICLKIGVGHYTSGQVWPGIGKILLGVLFYALGFGLWLIVLSKLPLSNAYPVLALNLVFVLLGSAVVLGEPLTPAKVTGISLIVVGVWIASAALG